MSTSTPQKFEFQAEIKQLLDIVIHSLYTEKEIFVRELVSNASDALEKLRHTQITEKDIFDDKAALEINVTTDDKAKTITIQDFGLGMTRAELVENLGTIAHSGSKAFLKSLGEGDKKNTNLIGQFGVGFYSAFMVAKSVKVYSHSWRANEPGHVWTSDGTGSYEIEEAADQKRGTKIVIELKDDCAQFAEESTVKEILERYSAFVSFPINLNGKRVNAIQALWLRNRRRSRTRNTPSSTSSRPTPTTSRASACISPPTPRWRSMPCSSSRRKTPRSSASPAPRRASRSIAAGHDRRQAQGSPPEWLRFLKGVVDSEDIPLNISRETMQDKALIEKLNKVITKRFLKFLEDEVKNRPDAYAEFYAEFGIFLKEGAAMDYTHKDALVKLLRFESSLTEKGKTTSLGDYVTRMGSEQKEIYYLIGPNRAAIESGPYLEGFKARNLEVLFCYEAVDEYVMSNVREFDGKKLTAADHADVKLADLPKPEGALSEGDTKLLTEWLKTTLGERVAEVKASDRLVDSPALALNADKFMSPHMRRMMKAMNKDGADAPVRVNLEINPRSAVMKRLFDLAALGSATEATHTASPEKAKLVAEQILDNALISAGLLDDATPMVARLYKLLESV